MSKFALALLFAPLPLFCADEALPKAEAVIDHWIEASGGKAAFEKRHNLVQHGSIDFAAQGLKGTLTIYEAAPDRTRAVIDLEGIGKIESGSDGEVAWENNPLQGPRVKQGVERTDALRDATFNAALFTHKLYAKAETTGVETAEGHDCYKVVLTPSEGQPTTEFFDRKSGLLVKTSATRTTQMGDIAAVVLYDDYRKDGDILGPHKLTNRAAGQEFLILIERVESNVDLPSDRFALPPEIQALLKKSDQPAAAPATPPAAANDAGRGKLNVFMAGNPVATENYTVRKSAGQIEIDGSGNATLGTMKIDIEQFKVTANDKYELVSATAKAKLGQIQMSVKTTFADGKAKNEMDSGQGPQTKEDAVHPGAVVVNANLPLYPWTLLTMRADFKNQDPQQFPVYVLGQAEVNATAVFKGREAVEFAGKTVDLNHLSVSGTTPQGQPIALDFWVDDSRKVIKMAVPSQGVEAYQEGFDRKAPAAVKGESKPGNDQR
jgi:hypothetical protein